MNNTSIVNTLNDKIIDSVVDKYKCSLCNKVFKDGSGLRKHKKKKKSCLPKDDIIQKLLLEKDNEIKKKESEIERLRNLMEHNFSKDVKDIKDIILETNVLSKDVQEKISNVENKIELSTPNINYNITQNTMMIQPTKKK